MSTLAARFRARGLRRVLDEHAEFYARGWTPASVDAWQLEQLNRTWREWTERVPHARRLRQEGRVPSELGDWREFSDCVPVTQRTDLQRNLADYVDPQRPADAWRATGGSTGAPLRTPVWRSELANHTADFWLARSWFGIAPDDALFLLWGHAHLLGSGIGGRLAAWRRGAQDALLGYRRASAYDLGDAAMRDAARQLLEFRPKYVLGYSVALDRLARVCADMAPELRTLRLRAAIATAESFPFSSSAAVVADVLGCPVAMEYGAVETGPLAHQRSDGSFAVFWRHYRLEGIPSPEAQGAHELLVTSLYPRCLPLVRYRIGDVVRGGEDLPRGFDAVVGRCNDSIRLADGRLVHSEVFAHVLRDVAAVARYQIVQTGGEVRVLYTGGNIDAVSEAEIRRRLDRAAPGLGAVVLERRESLAQTVAGKNLPVQREERA